MQIRKLAVRNTAVSMIVLAVSMPSSVWAAVGCPVVDSGNLAQTTAIAGQVTSQASSVQQMTTTTGAISDAMGTAGSGALDNVFNASSLSGGLNAAASDVNGASSSLTSGLSSLGNQVSSGISSGLNSLGQATGLGDVGSGLSDVASGTGSVGSAVKSIGSDVSAANNLVNAVGNATSTLNNLPNNALGAVVNGGTSGTNNGLAGAAGTNGGSSGIAGLASAASGAMSTINNAGSLANNANNVGSKIGNLGTGTVTTPSVASVSNSLKLPLGNGASVGISSLSNLSSSPSSVISMISAVSTPGLSAPPSANFSTVSNAQSWVTGTFYSPVTTSTGTQGIAQRRTQAVSAAAQTGYALALSMRANAGDSDKRAQALLQAGNAAKDQRGQLAALQAALTVLQGEMATIRLARASQLEIQASSALRDSPISGTP